MKTLAEELFIDFAKRAGISTASWKDQPNLHSQWKILAEMFEARVKMSASPAATSVLHAEADHMLRFVAGLDLQDLSLAVQRERRERVYALRRALGKK